MSENRIKALIAETFLEVADALETGQYGKKPVIGFASEIFGTAGIQILSG